MEVPRPDPGSALDPSRSTPEESNAKLPPLLLASLSVTKAILVAQFLRARAWWRLDSAGACALHVARSVVALLDAAAYLRDIPDDDPDLLALQAAGCFVGGVFDPGPEGADIIRSWQLADEPTAGPRDPRELLAELVRAAHQVAGTR
jgi:hypothetical protein